MPPDTGPKNVDPNSAAISTNVQHAGRPDRPLGRGLEDVSHLFLSQSTDEAVAREPSWSRSGSVLLRPRRSFTTDRLAAALREFDGALEEGMRAIDTNVPCDSCDGIDVMALDLTNQLTIIDIDTTPNEGLLLRGIGHFDWVVRNSAILRRMYRGHAINFSLPPRLFLVAPQFSPLLKSVARQITHPQIDWVKYHVADVFGGTGILFEHVEGQ